MSATRVGILLGIVIGAIFCFGIARAEALVMPLPPIMPAIHYDGCPDSPDFVIGGCYDIDTGDVYVSSPDRWYLHHELGHALDAQSLDPGERNRFARIIGHTGAPWWCYGATTDPCYLDGSSIGEMFADTYANCWDFRRGETSWTSSTAMAVPSRKHERHLCRFIRRAAR